MKLTRLSSTCLLAVVLAAGTAFVAPAHAADEGASTIKFSNPKNPGTLKIQLARGELRIKGADVQEITVKTDAKPVRTQRKDGLRVLTASTGFSLVEKDNVVTLDTLAEGWTGSGADFSLTVPRSTNIVVTNSWGGGDVRITDISGDIEVECTHGQVQLDALSGGALVTTMNGEIRASFAQLQEKKPLSFTSMNGEVQLRLPVETKANIRLRTQNGSILTDFDEAALVTKVESTARTSIKTVRPSRASTPGKPGVLPAEAQEAIREAARAGAEATREAAQAMREAAQAVREGAQEAARAAQADAARAGDPAIAPLPPKPPRFPTITPSGGKLVTGTLNGGGVEINVSTMNGDVTLRKVSQK
ncbi:MAG TPA: DUF4097 family beta strand repeat-containing protein [Opitutaceae bacterium]|nr:DUF4097 family beta strand repeat-containing protein [Opitutaceae bacterium]